MASERRTRSSIAARVILLACFLALMIFASIKLTPSISRFMKSPEVLDRFIESYGSISALVYAVLQIVQVVIFMIPGEIIQVAGGYIFGTWLGTLLSVVGILLGTIIAFFAARVFGYSLVNRLVSPKKLEKFEFLINNSKSEIAMFVLFLVPGIPKDSLVYISGLTPVKPLRFLAISIVARLPGIWGAAYIGAHLQQKDYLPVWILSGAALVLFVLGALNREWIVGRLHRLRRSSQDAPADERS